jgi:GTPase SAR1 family protein
MNNDELKIIMVAPRGIGKTSLLAAMHEEFDKTFASANLDTWTIDGNTLIAINECKQALKNIDPRLTKEVVPTPPKEDPWNEEGFMFEIGSGGRKFIRLKFTDPSGEYFRADARAEEKEYVKQQLNECHAVIIPIDATALMEKKTGRVNHTEIGTWHEEKNDPERITGLLKAAYQNFTFPRLVIFAPVKCEMYMQTSKDADNLLNHVKIGYRQLFDFFKSECLIHNIAIVVTPVQTIGNVVFAYHKTDNYGKTNFYYHKTPINAPYAPLDGDQPLRYVLRFLLNVSVEKEKESFLKQSNDLKQLEAKLGTGKEKLAATKKELEEKTKSLNERNKMWWPFKTIANWVDDKQTAYNQSKQEFDRANTFVQETQDSILGSKTQIAVTQMQIDKFNNAIFSFAVGCKSSNGFAVIQGSTKWLPIPKQMGLLEL